MTTAKCTGGRSQAAQGAGCKEEEWGSVQESLSGLESTCEQTHRCILERMLRETSPRTLGGSLAAAEEILSAGRMCVPARNCLPCLKSASSWRKFIYYAFISVSLTMSFLKSRLSSACSDKKLSPVRLLMSSGVHHGQCGHNREMAKTSLLFVCSD